MKKSAQTSKNRDFRKFEKSAPSKIENRVENSVFFNDRVIRYWIFKAHRLVPVSDFFIGFQSDFFKNRLKLDFLSFATFHL